MAKTYPSQALRVQHNESPFLSVLFREYPEADSQTFKVGWPLKLVSGEATEWVSVADADIAAFAAADAANDTDNDPVQVILAEPSKIVLYGNLMDTDIADEVLVAADLGAVKELAKDTDLLGTGEAGWYIRDQTAAPAVTVKSFRSDYRHPTHVESNAKVGDTNARIECRLVESVCLWTN